MSKKHDLGRQHTQRERPTGAAESTELAEEISNDASAEKTFPLDGLSALGSHFFNSPLWSALPDTILFKDESLRFAAANREYINIFDEKYSRVFGKTDFDFHPPEVAEKLKAEDERILETGEVFAKEMDMVRNGQTFSYQIFKARVLDEDSRPVGLLASIRDITGDKERNRKLKFSRVALDNAVNPIFWVNEFGEFLYVNKAACTRLEYSEEDFKKMHVWDIAPELNRQSWTKRWKYLLEKEAHDSVRIHRTRSGEEFPVNISSSILEDNGRKYVVTFAKDISKQFAYERSLERSREMLRSIFNGTYDAIFLHDVDGSLLDVNAKMLEMYCITREEALRSNIVTAFSGPNNDFEKLSVYWEAAMDGTPQFFQWQARRPRDGSLFDAEVFLRRIPYGETDVIMANVRDITARKKAEKQLVLSAKVFENSLEGILICDTEGKIIAVNPAFTKITGYDAKDVMGGNPRILKSDRHDHEFYKKLWDSLLAEGHWEGEIWNRRKSGEAYPEWLSISSVRNSAGEVTNYVAVFHDITELKAHQAKVRHLAYHDPLTDLPNRLLLKDRLRKALARRERAGDKLAVLFLDIDNFKNINDSLGHALGDIFLQSVANRLSRAVRAEDTVARLGGDEFVIMLASVEHVERVIQTAQRVLNSIQSPFWVDGHTLRVTTSIGVAMAPDDGRDEDTLLKNADMAMYKAKEQGKNLVQLYRPALNDGIVERFTLENDLGRAVRENEVEVFFQPRVALRTGCILGMEALARWNRPGHGFCSPGLFIPVAEESGLINSLGRKILNKACMHTKQFVDLGFDSLKVSVNLSPRQFQSKSLLNDIEKTLLETGLPPQNLELELTEQALMKDVRGASRIMNLLADMGVSLSIDDFGTGYSSLQYLKHFPLSALKIDQSFIRDVPGGDTDKAIVATIVSMCKVMELVVVAEGVETLEQLEYLRGLDCDEVQGFYYSPAVAPKEFVDLLVQSGEGNKKFSSP